MYIFAPYADWVVNSKLFQKLHQILALFYQQFLIEYLDKYEFLMPSLWWVKKNNKFDVSVCREFEFDFVDIVSIIIAT